VLGFFTARQKGFPAGVAKDGATFPLQEDQLPCIAVFVAAAEPDVRKKWFQAAREFIDGAVPNKAECYDFMLAAGFLHELNCDNHCHEEEDAMRA
jgi:hypothetical protein